MPTSSMEPALKVGNSFIYATNAYKEIADVKRWDIIAYTHKFDFLPAPSAVVKRVIGLPGDKLNFEGNTIILNGSPIKLPTEIVLNYKGLINPEFKYLITNNCSVIVPADCVFAIGDNAVISCDSRSYGPIHFKDILGKVTLTPSSTKTH